MNTKKFLDGLQILVKYFDKPDGFHLGAEHDVIYVYATDRPVTEEDFTTLKSLGWYQTDSPDEEYDHSLGWYAYV